MDLNFTVFPHPPTPSPGRGDVGCYYVYKNNFIMDRVQAQQNCTRSLRNTRESARRQENGEQARRQTKNANHRSRRQQESAEQLEQWRQARNDSLRSMRQKEYTEQMEQGDKPEMTVLDRGDSLRSRRQ